MNLIQYHLLLVLIFSVYACGPKPKGSNSSGKKSSDAGSIEVIESAPVELADITIKSNKTIVYDYIYNQYHLKNYDKIIKFGLNYIQLFNDDNSMEYTRRIYHIVDLLSEVGGLMNSLKLIGLAIAGIQEFSFVLKAI